MKKLFKNILLTTTAVAGIVIPTTIVAKQSNYVEATSSSTLTPMVMPVYIAGEYEVEGDEAATERFISNHVAFFFDVDQLYDLGIISTDISNSTDPEVWYAAAIEATENIHFSGEYTTSAVYWGEDWIYGGETFDSFEITPPPLLTEDYELSGTNPDNMVYEISEDANYLTLGLHVFFDLSTSTDPDHHLQELELIINEFYYTTVDDQTTKHEINLSDMWRTNSLTQFHSFSFSSDDFDNNFGAPAGTTISYNGGQGYDYSNQSLSFTHAGETVKWESLEVKEFDVTPTPWWTWLILSVVTVGAIALVWWGIHALRNRRKNSKTSSETKA